MDKKVGKKEILLLVIIFVAAVIGYFVFQKMQSTPGGQVKVTTEACTALMTCIRQEKKRRKSR